MAEINKINVDGTNYDIRDAGATRTTVIPNDNGEIKTKYRIAKKDYTGGASTYWYYEICKLPTNNSGNYASAIISGRIGGWESGNMSYINALIWNRGTPGLAVIDVGGHATAASTIWNICDLVIYTNSDGTATLYAKCANWFTFDLDLELFQSTASITYTGNKLTSVSGTLNSAASTTTSRMELISGELYVAGTKMSKRTHTHSYSGTTGGNSGSAVAAVTGVTSDGKATVLTSVKVSNSSSAAPGGHTHGVSGTSGNNSGTAVAAVTGYGSFSGGSGSLTANSTSTNGIKYVESISSTGASASGTDKAGSESHTHTYTKATGVSLGSNTTASGGIAYIEDVTHTAATLSGDKTFVTGVSGGSGSLAAYDASTGGTVQVSNGNRIPVITSLSKDGYTPAGSVTLTNGTAPSLGGATTKYLSATFTGSAATTGGATSTTTSSSGGSGSSANTGSATPTFTGSEVTSGGASATTTSSSSGSSSSNTGYNQPSFTGSAVTSEGASSTIDVLTGEYSNGTLTLSTATVATGGHTHSVTAKGTVANHRHTYSAPANHTHTLDHTHSVTAAGSVGSHYHSYTKPANHTHTLEHTHSVTATGSVGLTANNSTATGRIKYVEAQGTFSAGTTPKSGASFSGTNSTTVVTGGTTYYLAHSHSAASASGTGTVGISGGSISKTTKYFHPSITTASTSTGGPSATTTFVTGITGGTTSATTKYLHHAHTAASLGSPTTASAAPNSHTHSISITSGANSGTNFNAATAVSGNGTASALTGVKASGTANVAPSGHTHGYSGTTGSAS